MATKKNILKEFASVDGQSVIPDAAVSGDAHRAADQSGGETSYSQTTKSEVLAAIMNDLQNRSSDEVLDVFNSLNTNNPAQNKRPADKASADSSSVGEIGQIRLSPTSVDTSASMEAVGDIFSGEELSESLKTRAATIFEATVNSRISIIEARLEEEAEKTLNEAIDLMYSELVESVDKYVTYVAEQWVDANKLAVGNGLKAQMAEQFISAMKTVFEENYITVSEEKVDVLEAITAELEETKSRLNEAIDKNIALSEQIEDSAVKDIISEASAGMTISKKEKFFSLVENINYNSLEELSSKIDNIKETYFNEKTNNTSAQPLTEGFEGEVEERKVSPNMRSYVDALSRTLK